jgi:hypothetical protein
MAQSELNHLGQTVTAHARDLASIPAIQELMHTASSPTQVNQYDPPGWYDLFASSP